MPPAEVSVPHASFAARVVAWQRSTGRHDLPWQDTRDAYRIWLSEIMLQQTQVATVIPYYHRFLDSLPDVAALAGAPLQRVLELWSGLGYYRRAHLLHAASQVVVRDHRAVFPTDAATLAGLPGIGRSTAAAIAAFSSGERGAILDGNVKRVLARHEGIDGFPGAPAVERALWARADALLPERDIEDYTQGMMDLGATLCLRANPRCLLCPVAEDCLARCEGRIAELPAPRPKKTLPHRTVTLLLLERAGEVLLERRPATGIWGGLWSLPEIAPGGDAIALCRTRFAADVALRDPLQAITHGFTHFTLDLTPQPCDVLRWPKQADEPGLLWLPFADIGTAALPSPIRKLLQSRALPAGAP
jgi:A/G-specific adenine glycosylase